MDTFHAVKALFKYNIYTVLDVLLLYIFLTFLYIHDSIILIIKVVEMFLKVLEPLHLFEHNKFAAWTRTLWLEIHNYFIWCWPKWIQFEIPKREACMSYQKNILINLVPRPKSLQSFVQNFPCYQSYAEAYLEPRRNLIIINGLIISR